MAYGENFVKKKNGKEKDRFLYFYTVNDISF